MKNPTDKPENLLEGLKRELVRNRELLRLYIEIPTGTMAAGMIAREIQAGEKALSDMDTVSMIRCFKTLEQNKP